MSVLLNFKVTHFPRPFDKVMSYLIAFLMVVLSQSVVHANEIKEAIPVQNHSVGSVLQLTPNEQEWLAKHKTIRIAYDGNLPPYSFINDSGKIDGVAVEIMAILSKRLGVNFTIYPESDWSRIYRAAARRKVDMVATMVSRPERAEWFSFTKPYLTKSLVIVTKQDSTIINNRDDIKDKKVAVVKGYQYGEQIGNEFPTARRFKAETMLDSLKEVDKGRVDAAVIFLGTANYLQAKHQLSNLRIAAFYDRNSANESIAVRKDWPVLVGILQKGLDSLTEDEVQKVFAKWVVGGGIPSSDVAIQKPQAPAEPVSKPVTKPPVVEVEQAPANYATPKTMPKPAPETAGIGKMTVFLLIALALFLLWLALGRKQKKRRPKTKNVMRASSKNLQSTHNETMHLTIEPSIEADAEEFEEFKDEFKPQAHEQTEYPVNEYVYYQHDCEGRFSYVSQSVTSLLGYTSTDFIANYRSYLTDNPINRRIDDYVETCIKGQPNEPYEIEIYDSGRDIHWFEVMDTPVYDGQGHCIGVDGVMHDITKTTMQRLYEQLDLTTLEPVGSIDPLAPVVSVDPLAPADPIVPVDLLAPADPLASMVSSVQAEPIISVGSLAPVDPLTPVDPIASVDLLAPVKPLAPVGSMDLLAPVKSNYPQRLHSQLQQAIQLANEKDRAFALIYLSLDRLRFLDGNPVNQPEVEVLNEAAKRLRATLRDTDVVVQLGVEQFALILLETEVDAARLIVEKIRTILQVPYLVGVQSIVLNANMGIAFYPKDGNDPEALVSAAQVLSYPGESQPAKPKPSAIIDDSLSEEEEEDSLRLQQDLVIALDECKLSLRTSNPYNVNALHRHSQFSVYYQSRHSLKDYSITGFEALIRWRHPELGLLLPKDFVDLATDIGLLDVMTYWIIQQVSFQAVAWEKKGIRPRLMMINLGDLAIKQAVEVSKIIAIIKETGAKPEWLGLSIAESEIAKNPDLVIPVIEQLVAARLSVAIDDFGSDSAVLALIKTIPAQIVEIDPAFIRTLPNSKDAAEIVNFSIAMLHELGKTVIAKEVETEQQLEFLKASGCDVIQGHLLSRPLPPKEAKELIENLPDFAWYFRQ